MEYELGFLGAGNMAEAIAKAAIQQGVLDAQQIIAADPNDERQAVFSRLGVAVAPDNTQVISQSKQIMLAVKPQMMTQAATDVGRCGSEDSVVLSIMAGVTTQKLSQAIAQQGQVLRPRVIRIMPNTPLQVGMGMAGIALGQHAVEGDEALAMRLFAAAGKVVRVDEAHIDAITAVSGSGPAYVFYLAQAMAEAAQELGLGQHARVLVQQTILGAAQLMAASPETPAELRRKVTSPGGTTEAAITCLEEHQAAQAFVEAIKAAAKRSAELGG